MASTRPLPDVMRTASADTAVHVAGIVMSVGQQKMTFSSGTKVVLLCGGGRYYVSLLLFEGKPQLAVGNTLVVLGAHVWTNSKTNHVELSASGNALVATNAISVSKDMQKRCREQDLSGLTNLSAVPSGELTTMFQLKARAERLADDLSTVGGAVMLRLDPQRPSSNGTLSYNGCTVCRKKVKPLDERDADGNQLFDHDVEQKHSHRSNTYESHYFFTGRFHEEDDSQIYLYKVDDALGLSLFGLTSDQLMDSDNIDLAMKPALSTAFRYNVDMDRAGEIQSMVMVK